MCTSTREHNNPGVDKVLLKRMMAIRHLDDFTEHVSFELVLGKKVEFGRHFELDTFRASRG